MPDAATMEKIVALCKRRGFVFASSEIYGGLGSAYDYGHYGVLLKTNVKNEWWRAMVQQRDDIVALDSAIILHPKTWEASGHLAGFSDPLVQCLGKCKRRWRADHLREAQPEAAQGIFLNFKNALQTSRKKPPFGIAQVGKSFRNEITPGNFIFRTREFEQMELEYFVEPGADEKWFEYWLEERWNWYIALGLKGENVRRYEHPKDKLSHYSKRTVDIEYYFPFRGWSELEGIANRTDYDLKQHAAFSGENLTYFDQATGQSYVPYVIEPAGGPHRIMLAFLVEAYNEEEVRGETRTVLKLHPRLAPIKASVFPLTKKEPVAKVARELYDELKGDYRVFYDDSGAIGRRYRRQDEAGTPFCLTVDFDTLEDKQVTVRDRDTIYG